jgi:hypothetical protein
VRSQSGEMLGGHGRGRMGSCGYLPRRHEGHEGHETAPHQGWRRNWGRLGVVYSRWGRRSSPVGLTPRQDGRCRPSESRNDLPCRTYRLPPKGSDLPPARIVLPPQGNRLARGKIISRPNETSALSAKSTLAPRIPIRIPENHRSPPIFPSPRAREHLPGDQTIALAVKPARSRRNRLPCRRPNQVPPLGIRCPRRGTAGFIDPTARQATLPAPQSTSPASSDRNSLVTRSIDPPCKLYRLAKEEGRLANRQIAGPSARSGGNRRWRSDTSRKTAQRTSFLNLIRCGWSAEVPFRLW